MSTLYKELALISIDINMDCERQQYLRVLPTMVIQRGSSPTGYYFQEFRYVKGQRFHNLR